MRRKYYLSIRVNWVENLWDITSFYGVLCAKVASQTNTLVPLDRHGGDQEQPRIFLG